nr:MAG TPA: hypothetical protein [Caudoviricetes sp.]
MSIHQPIHKGMPAVLAHYLPSTHDVKSLDDLSELFLTTRSRILAESNSREMDFIDQEKKLRADYDDTIAETESRLRALQDELNQLIHCRESALRMLHSDRESYKSEVQTRLVMLGLWLRDKRDDFKQREKQALLAAASSGEVAL